jgi:hypothetical protein
METGAFGIFVWVYTLNENEVAWCSRVRVVEVRLQAAPGRAGGTRICVRLASRRQFLGSRLRYDPA